MSDEERWDFCECRRVWPVSSMKPHCPVCQNGVGVGARVRIVRCISDAECSERHGNHKGTVVAADKAGALCVLGTGDPLLVVYAVHVPDSTFIDHRVYALEVELLMSDDSTSKKKGV